MGIVTLQVGNLALDAFQAWDHTASDPVQVKTDTYVPDPQCDYNWNMTFLYDMVTNVGTAQFCDAGTHNQHGPAILCLKSGAMETRSGPSRRQAPPLPGWRRCRSSCCRTCRRTRRTWRPRTRL
jgi:hypothetical protein